MEKQWYTEHRNTCDGGSFDDSEAVSILVMVIVFAVFLREFLGKECFGVC